MRGISSMAKVERPARGELGERRLGAIGVHDRDDERAGVHTAKLRRTVGRRTASTTSAPFTAAALSAAMLAPAPW